MAQSDLVWTCEKCGRRLPRPGLRPTYCAKCELVNALLVERYTTHERAADNGE